MRWIKTVRISILLLPLLLLFFLIFFFELLPFESPTCDSVIDFFFGEGDGREGSISGSLSLPNKQCKNALNNGFLGRVVWHKVCNIVCVYTVAAVCPFSDTLINAGNNRSSKNRSLISRIIDSTRPLPIILLSLPPLLILLLLLLFILSSSHFKHKSRANAKRLLNSSNAVRAARSWSSLWLSNEFGNAAYADDNPSATRRQKTLRWSIYSCNFTSRIPTAAINAFLARLPLCRLTCIYGIKAAKINKWWCRFLSNATCCSCDNPSLP